MSVVLNVVGVLERSDVTAEDLRVSIIKGLYVR